MTHRCVDCLREDPEGHRRSRKIFVWSGAERCATHVRRPGKLARRASGAHGTKKGTPPGR